MNPPHVRIYLYKYLDGDRARRVLDVEDELRLHQSRMDLQQFNLAIE